MGLVAGHAGGGAVGGGGADGFPGLVGAAVGVVGERSVGFGRGALHGLLVARRGGLGDAGVAGEVAVGEDELPELLGAGAEGGGGGE